MNKFIIGGVTTLVIALMIAATGWNFAAVADMPKVYQTKQDHQEDMVRIDKKLDIIIRHLLGGNRDE